MSTCRRDGVGHGLTSILEIRGTHFGRALLLERDAQLWNLLWIRFGASMTMMR